MEGWLVERSSGWQNSNKIYSAVAYKSKKQHKIRREEGLWREGDRSGTG